MSSEVIPANTSVNNRNQEVFNDDIGDGDCIHEKSIHDSICVLTLNDEDITMNNNDNTNETASNKLSISNNIKDNKSFKHSKSSIYHIDNNIQNKLTKNLTGKVISNTNCDKSITDTNSCYLTSTVQLHSDESTYSDDHIPICSNRSNKQLLQTTGTMNNNAMICKHTGKEKHFVIKEQEISTTLDKPNGISCISNVNPNVLSVFRGRQCYTCNYVLNYPCYSLWNIGDGLELFNQLCHRLSTSALSKCYSFFGYLPPILGSEIWPVRV